MKGMKGQAGPSIRAGSGAAIRGRGIRSGRSFTGGRASGKGSGRGRGTPKREIVESAAPSPVHVETETEVEVETSEEKPDIYDDIDPEDQALLDLLNSDNEDDDDDDDVLSNDDVEEKSNRGTEDSYHLRDSNYFDEDGAESGSEDEFDTQSFDQPSGGTFDRAYFDEDEEHRKLLEALEGAIDSEEDEYDEEGSSDEVEDPSFIDDDVLVGSGIVSPFTKESKPKTPPPVLSPVDKRRDRVRLRVMEEILVTERTYYSRLCILVDCFLEPLVKFVESHQDKSEGQPGVPPRTMSNHSDSDRQKGVPPRTTSNRSDTEMSAGMDVGNFFSLPDASTELSLIEDCFGNVRELREFTKLFLEDLERSYTEQNMGPVFTKHCDDEFSDLYYNYMRVYKEGRGKLERLQGKFWFTVFVGAVQLQPQTKNLLLRDFLIEPVQRVPRYKLLLGELMKHTETGDVLDKLKEAHAQVGKVALDINGKLNKFEQANKIHTLSVSWGFDLKKKGREFIREGVLTKTDRRGRPSSFHFLLFSDLLVFGNSIGRRGSFKGANSSEKFKLKFRAPLCDCLVIDGRCVVNSEQTRQLSDLPALTTLAEVKRRRSSVGDRGMGSMARAAAAQVSEGALGGGDDIEMMAALKAAEMVGRAAREEEHCKRSELECKSWKVVIEAGLTLERLQTYNVSEDTAPSFVIATPIKTLVLTAPNRQQHNAWVESFSSSLTKLQAGSDLEGGNSPSQSSGAPLFPPASDDRPPSSPRARRRSIGGLFGGGGGSHQSVSHQYSDLESGDRKESAPRPPMSRRRSFFGGKLGAVARDVSKDKHESPKVATSVQL